MKRSNALHPAFFLCVVLILSGALACGLGASTPTDAPEKATDTPSAAVEADTPTPTDTPTPPPPKGIDVQSATFALGLDDEGQAVNPVDEFAPDQKIYLVLTFKGSPRGIVTGEFYRGDEFLGKADIDLSDVEGGSVFSIGETIYVNFWMEADSEQPSRIGDDYRIDVFYDGDFVDSYPFEVVPPADALPSEIKEVTLAQGADDDYNAIGPTAVFAPDEEVFMVGEGDLGLYSQLKAEWYVDGELDEEGTRSLTLQENTSDAGFFFSFLPDEGWPLGEHEAALLLDGDEVGRYAFTIEEAVTVSPEELELFEDPDGLFTIRYPADFDDIEPETENYGYSFSTQDGNSIIGVLLIPGQGALNDDQWAAFVDVMTTQGLASFGEDLVELDRQEGSPGVHVIYLEIESQQEDLHGLAWLEESEGVLAMVVLAVPISDWPQRQAELETAIESFAWSPGAVQGLAAAEAAPPPTPTSPAPPPATPTPQPPPAPSGKGTLVMLNCRGDVVTVDVLPVGVFQELAPKAGDDCRPGDPIPLDPGDYTLRASIAGVPSKGEANITIQAGTTLTFTWY
jgi:hypothetical protein